ncbi:hypothetical protein CK203_084408 [Vitis vinifera]|uniref:Uncharacterized protein n=1 Tax=Vitis vinifera TaxID=29760 RepID=A0A438EN86_VITVI|nr:hypothetical protein CK203_084408 [Vitis vinifera]
MHLIPYSAKTTPKLGKELPYVSGGQYGKREAKEFSSLGQFSLGFPFVLSWCALYAPSMLGEPGKLIRERYRTASQVVQNQLIHNPHMNLHHFLISMLRFHNGSNKLYGSVKLRDIQRNILRNEYTSGVTRI